MLEKVKVTHTDTWVSDIKCTSDIESNFGNKSCIIKQFYHAVSAITILIPARLQPLYDVLHAVSGWWQHPHEGCFPEAKKKNKATEESCCRQTPPHTLNGPLNMIQKDCITLDINI